MTKIDNFTEWIKTLDKTSQTTYTIARNVLFDY